MSNSVDETKDVIKNLLISTLKEHSENEKYFDNVVGEDYDNLIKSIKTTGVTTPIHVTADMTIISGHQRVRACKELGIESVPCIIRDDITTEEEKLEHLISSNFGRSQNSEAKKRAAIMEYLKLCGLKHGDKKRRHDGAFKLKEISEITGVSERQLNRYNQLNDNLAPETLELLDTNQITTSIALNAFCKMPKENQVEFLKSIDTEVLKELTTKQVQDLVDQYKLELKNNYEREEVKYLEAQEELQKQKFLKETSQDITSQITKKTEKVKELDKKIHEQKINLYEAEKINQHKVLYVIHRAIEDLRIKKAEFEHKVNQFQKAELELDEYGLAEIDDALIFLEDFMSIINNFKNIKNIDSMELIVYEE